MVEDEAVLTSFRVVYSASKLGVKRVLIFTNNDDPLAEVSAAEQRSMRNQTIAKARVSLLLGKLTVFPWMPTSKVRHSTVSLLGIRFDPLRSALWDPTRLSEFQDLVLIVRMFSRKTS